MGCHTWFYKKVETPPYEEMKEVIIQIYKRSISEMTGWIDNPQGDKYLEILSAYPNWTIEYITNFRNADIRRLQMIEKDLCKVAVINKYCTCNSEIMEYINGSLYVDLDDYHDVFRKYGYPKDRLFSLDETLAYIENPVNECVTFYNTIEILTDFWTKHPNGMITFG